MPPFRPDASYWDYFSSNGASATVAANQNIVSLENPNASGKVINIYYVDVVSSSVAVAAINNALNLSRAPVPSAGAVGTVIKRNTNHGTATGIIRGAPTVTPAASGFVYGTFGGALVTAAGEAAFPCRILYSSAWFGGSPLVILPNTSAVIWCSVASDVDIFNQVFIAWGEGSVV